MQVELFIKHLLWSVINRQYLNYHQQQQQKAIRGRFTIFKTVSRQCSHAHIKTLKAPLCSSWWLFKRFQCKWPKSHSRQHSNKVPIFQTGTYLQLIFPLFFLLVLHHSSAQKHCVFTTFPSIWLSVYLICAKKTPKKYPSCKCILHEFVRNGKCLLIKVSWKEHL